MIISNQQFIEEEVIGKLVREYSDKKDVILIDNGIQRKIGTTSEEIRIFDDRSGMVLERTQKFSSEVMGNRTAVMAAVHETLLPLSTADLSDEAKVQAVYQNGQVIVSGDSQETEVVLSDPHCFDMFAVEVLLRILILQPGYKRSISAFSAYSAQEMNVTVEVVGQEEVDEGKGKMMKAWKVETYFGDMLQYYWIGCETKELLKQSSKIGEGLVMEFRR